jgi:uncharacterized protein (TIGR01777 family)
MKIFMTGGTGFVGRALTRAFLRQGYGVTVLTRRKNGESPQSGLSLLEADPTRRGEWQDRVPEHDVIVNLAGASIFERWTEKKKRLIRESRLLTTKHLVEALSGGKGGGIRLLSTSAIGYYGVHGDESLDEESPPGEGFLASLSRDWETAATAAEGHGAGVVILRFGVVLGRGGGAFREMVPVFRRYMGSPLGSGRQWFSWIHQEDLVNIYLHILNDRALSGPFNCTAPHPVTNAEMTRILADEMGKPALLPAVPQFVLKMILGEFASVVVKGQRVLPNRLLKAGFQFRFPEIRGAFRDLLRKEN